VIKISWFCECGAYCKGEATREEYNAHLRQKALHKGHKQTTPEKCAAARRKNDNLEVKQ